ncbi:MAG: tetratricopeptide repeat protein, partial [Akkermansiaceae bacterium]|nr:tetratricopeptide repeat protein [Akkermansiaceae bacterium]
MNKSPKTRPLILSLLALWLLLGSALEAEVVSRISSRFLARGERALLEVAVQGERPTSSPEIAPIQGVEIRPTGRGSQIQRTPGKLVEHVFTYIVSSFEVGIHRIEPIMVEVGNDRLWTQPLEFSVFNPDELNWSTAQAGNSEFRYASAFKVLDERPYVNQAVPVEIKVFIPRDLTIIDWGIPDFTRDGLTAWRMQPREMRSEINLLGKPYISVAYPSTLTPNRSGEVSIGPANLRLIASQLVVDRILRREAVEVRLQVPELELQAKPLPDNAPSGFENAVGQFEIQISTEDTEVLEGDPIPIDIRVTGSGNLDTLRPPAPVSSRGWKIYEASRQERGDERRELSGTVKFQQFLRPRDLQSSIPAYELVFFNPESQEYESVRSEPIALQMTLAPAASPTPSGPPPKVNTPVEEMSDILGLMPNSQLTHQPRLSIDQRWLHALGLLLALILLGRALSLRFGHLLQPNPVHRERLSELRRLEKETGDDRAFLMASGRFIERWLGREEDPELREIIKERDANCFRREDEQAVQLEPKRRRDILSTLRRHATSCILLFLLLTSAGSLEAKDANQLAREAYESARYDDAIEIWLTAAPYAELSEDTLYHIGNACYRAGSTGHAALYYRRALARDPQHAEARQNLRFIERKVGSLSIKHEDYQYLIARLPLEAWRSATWGGIWLCVL